MFDTDTITKPVAAVTAVLTMLGGGYSLYDKIKLPPKDILRWDAEHFSISNGHAYGAFKVVVARQKIRDDCAVEEFGLEVRDSEFIVHNAKPSIAKFSGPATSNVDKFGYTITLEDPDRIAVGPAKLFARIVYKCPEGTVVISYPDHRNLNFNIEDK